ncbi:MAG TPA: FAD-dependent oxidoreductase [Dongiaceae bacterium]|nr:FAD-dependent oxidoreductase [Dongiaceae bacterium]
MIGFGRKPRVCIVGGGFAGLNAAQQLKSSRYDVTVIDPSPHIEWLPNIHEIISGVKKGDELRLNRSILLRRHGHRFLMNRAVEMSSSFVKLDNGDKIPFDVCIVATGSVDNSFKIPGADRHVMPMKSVEQCQAIAKRLHRVTLGHRTCRVAVVGGGIEGVEAFGEILRTYRDRPQFDFTIVDSAERLLSRCPGNLDGTIRRHTDRYRVDYLLGKSVEEVDAEGICFSDGTALESDLIIWSGGAAPNPFLTQSSLTQSPQEWAAVNGAFQSRNRENVFIIGDAAQPDGLDLSKQAFHAIDMGKVAAQNVDRLLAGKSLREFVPSNKPQLVTFGYLDTFMLFRDFALSSSVLGVAKEAIYTLGLLQMSPPKSAKDVLNSLDLLQKSVRRVYLPAFNPLNLIDKLPKAKLLS